MAIEAFAALRRQIAAEHTTQAERHELVSAEYDRAVAGLAEFASRPGAPAALRAIQRRVDQGELTWDRVIADGRALEAVFKPHTPKGRQDND